MAQEFNLKKRFINHFGIDLKSTDLTRPEQFASFLKNAQYRKSGAVEKRKGYQPFAESVGGFGLFTYNRVNPTTNVEEPEVLALDQTVNKLLEATITITYTGADATALVSIFFDVANDEYKLQLQEGASIVLDQSLGKGFDEASPITLATVDTNINALANFTSVLTGTTTTPAAFLKVTRNQDLSASGGPFVGTAGYWESVDNTLTNPFSGSESNKNDLDFENISSVQIKNVVYFSNGYNDVQKYDGQTLYRAGLPDPASISVALVGGGSVTGTGYIHVSQHIQVDAVGNIIEGNFLKSSPGLSPAGQSFDVTVSNILAGSGFNTNCAIVAGAQVSVNTITVDDGSAGAHTMKAGDKAYFFDSISASFVTRNVTSVAATTITIDGAAVTVADNAVISNNLKIAIFRSQTSATTPTAFFLVAEIPNNSFASTQVFNDDLIDTALGAQFIEPLTDRSPPPRGKYISSFRNQMVVAGKLDQPNTVFFSDVENPEYHPVAVNNFDVDTVFGDIITGIAPNNEVFAIFKTKSLHILSGDIASTNIRIDQLADDIGCAAHASIVDVEGSLFFLSNDGPFKMVGGQLPEPLGGNRLEPVFDSVALTEETKSLLFGTQIVTPDETLRLKRAIGLNDRNNEQYFLYVPTESTTGGDRHSNATSKVFVLDYERDAWLIWDNINAAGGITIRNEELFFSERRFSSFNSSVDHIFYRRMQLSDAFDYQDHDTAIDFDYTPQWEALGEPSVYKKFLDIRFFVLEDMPNNELILTVKTEGDYIRDVTRGEFTLNFSGQGYGVAPYGDSAYGNPSEPVIKRRLGPGKFRSLRIRFLNNRPQENVVLSGWEIQCVAPFRKQFKT